METLEHIVRLARDCHTKAAWESLFSTHAEAIASASNSKPIADLFRELREDPHCALYDASLWNTLIKGCLSSWNLDLGLEISHFALKTRSPSVALSVAQLYLDSGHPANARDIASRAMRLVNLTERDRLQLEMILALAYANESKYSSATRILARLKTELGRADLTGMERAALMTRMAGAHFFLGRYAHAGEMFYETRHVYIEEKNWEAAAKAVYNAAASYANAGSRRQEHTFELVEECRRIAEKHDLKGPLSFCEAFYGLDDYQRGEFSGAREHFRKALEHLPTNDRGPRRLHILTMLTLVYLASGRFHHAQKTGELTLKLASADESTRFEARYLSLKAELEWHEGKILEALSRLEPVCRQYTERGLHNIEEVTTLGRYLLLSAEAGVKIHTLDFEADESLKRNVNNWSRLRHGIGMQRLLHGEFDKARALFEESLAGARQMQNKHIEALSLQSLFQCAMLEGRPYEELEKFSREFSIVVARMEEGPLRVNSQILAASLAYHAGRFDECARLLRLAEKMPRGACPERFALECWLSVIEGRSCRLTSDWQMSMLAFQTRRFFHPTFRKKAPHLFVIADKYEVPLERHPQLAELLTFLMERPRCTASAEDIQEKVWGQSLEQQGWQQKIRNTIMRLRAVVPQTLAPLILHQDNIRLFEEAVRIERRPAPLESEDESVVRILRQGALSSQQVADRMDISLATAKRLLKRLVDEGRATPAKEGRNVTYHIKA